MRRTPAFEKTDDKVEAVVSGGRFVTKTAVFFGAEGVGAGFELDATADVDAAGVLPFVALVLEV